jgi:RNase H-fold protein (predicted Holliday junction resolvase)
MEKHIDTPIVYWDERYTTRQAQEILSRRGTRGARGRRGKHSLDSIAAAVILQEYLDHMAQSGHQVSAAP